MNQINLVLKIVLIPVLMFFLRFDLEAFARREADIVVQKNDGIQLHKEIIAIKSFCIIKN